MEQTNALLDKFVAQTQPVVYSETGGWLVTRTSGPVLNAEWKLSEWAGADGRAVALVMLMNGSVERLSNRSIPCSWNRRPWRGPKLSTSSTKAQSTFWAFWGSACCH